MQLTDAEIKKYVIDTIRTGNKERIQLVLARYQKHLKERKENINAATQTQEFWKP